MPFTYKLGIGIFSIKLGDIKLGVVISTYCSRIVSAAGSGIGSARFSGSLSSSVRSAGKILLTIILPHGETSGNNLAKLSSLDLTAGLGAVSLRTRFDNYP